MRIIIDIDKDGVPVQVQAEAESDEAREMDGGAPPAMLSGVQASLQASFQASDQSAGDALLAKTAGGPPEWLVQAIETAMAADAPSQDEAAFEDGGAAPV